MPIIGDMIRVTPEIKQALARLKIIPEEPYYKVIERLIKAIEFDSQLFNEASRVIPKNFISQK